MDSKMKIQTYSNNYIYKTADDTGVAAEISKTLLFPGTWAADSPPPDGVAAGTRYYEYRLGVDSGIPLGKVYITEGKGVYKRRCTEDYTNFAAAARENPDLLDGYISEDLRIEEYCVWELDTTGQFPTYEAVVQSYTEAGIIDESGAASFTGDVASWSWGSDGGCNDASCRDFFTNTNWSTPRLPSEDGSNLLIFSNDAAYKPIDCDRAIDLETDGRGSHVWIDGVCYAPIDIRLRNRMQRSDYAYRWPTYKEIWDTKVSAGWLSNEVCTEPTPPIHVIEDRVSSLGVSGPPEGFIPCQGAADAEPVAEQQPATGPVVEPQPEQLQPETEESVAGVEAPAEEASPVNDLIEAGPQGGWPGYIEAYREAYDSDAGHDVWEAWMKSHQAWGANHDYDSWRVWYKAQHSLAEDPNKPWQHGEGADYNNIVRTRRYMMQADQAISAMMSALEGGEAENEARDAVYAGLGKCVDGLISLANNLDDLGHSNETNTIDLLIKYLVGEGRE